MGKDITYILKNIVPEWYEKQKRLITRRQGLKSHLHLTRVFHEIALDKYVKMARDKA